MTFVVIPVRNEWRLTRGVLDCLEREPVDDVLICDNGSEDETAAEIRALQRQGRAWQRRLVRSPQAGKSIYQMWNHGFQRAHRLANFGRGSNAKTRSAFCVLFLNNDIALPPGWVKLLRDALKPKRNWCSYPDYDEQRAVNAPATAEVRYTRGVLGDGGMFGACFMLAGHRIPWRPLITDQSYEWWYGDNHLAECIQQEGGRQARVVGLPVAHENEATARAYPELYLAKLRDRGRWVHRDARGRRAIDRRQA